MTVVACSSSGSGSFPRDGGEPDAAEDSDAGGIAPQGPAPWTGGMGGDGKDNGCAVIDCPQDARCIGGSCVPFGSGQGGVGGFGGAGGR